MPARKKKILSHIRDIRGGKLNDPEFKSRMRGEGIYAEQIKSLFRLACRRAGMNAEKSQLSTASFRRPGSTQLSLFER
jgi:hypothetical protein